MKVYRRNWLLGALVVALVGVDLSWRAPAPQEREVARLFPELYADRALGIVVAHDGQRLELERTALGEPWRLTDQFGYPAYGPAVENFLRGVASLTNLDLVSGRSDAHAEYGVDASGTSVRVTGDEGSSLASFVQGAPLARETGCYVRVDSQDEVFRARGLRELPTDPVAWLDPRLFDFAPAVVTSLEASGGALAAPLSVTRDERPDNWRRADGSRPKPETVREALRDLSGRFFVDRVVAASTGDVDFGAPRLVVHLGELGGARHSLLVGRDATPEEGGGVLVAREEGGFVLHLSAASWDALQRVLARLAG